MSYKFWNRHKAGATEVPADSYTSDSEPGILHDGGLAYTRAKAGNDSGATYQEAVGAPVELRSPLGYNVGWATIIFLNVNQMVGTGIFSTPGTILGSTGSIGLALFYWVIGFLMAAAGLAVYLELAAYFPNRSGSETVYLEQAYPRPKHFFPIAFAVQSVILSFSASNAIVLSRYIWRIAEKTPTDWESKGVAVAAYTLAVICVIANNRFSLWATNVLGVFKIALLIVISITGFVVLGGHTSVANPGANFKNPFDGTTDNGNDLSGAMNAFNVVAEIKRPIPTLKKYATISVLLVAVLYILCNVAYFAAVPKEEFAASKEIAAGVFFTAVFGSRGSKALNVLVLLSAFGNLLAVLIGQSRLIREIGRQGVLPWTQFWVSTRPFGTPIGPYLLKWFVTFIMIVGPPAGDAFQFVVSLKTYPDSMFLVAMTLGVYIFRYRYKRVGRERAEFKAWDVAVIFYLLTNVYLLVMPCLPGGGGVLKSIVIVFLKDTKIILI
ncbi:hypothetical protein KVR01_004299 [Diaporthe batatas]|uniref:uncharacterized protein n=1 Tax=Diaporthe batatas TaxID=748121 RepID=UPI001D03B2BB|nr:uncharacterized protein KVR01_004299 [Diaporthe batatas]KAG8165747.1 hypothetical protein KVR01_004299 [Diaporthe batatas]